MPLSDQSGTDKTAPYYHRSPHTTLEDLLERVIGMPLNDEQLAHALHVFHHGNWADEPEAGIHIDLEKP